ncbi:Transcriptional regulator, LysR family [hydrothermal vent metagenome]|uniref:Transcriptional regulator, LysR family n=1 Tax=hydrothermal vent metagenome TaxID=652676 RepID=A0A3B0Y6G9_9ZZZZ
MNLNSLNMFTLVVSYSGFSEASRRSGIPVATLSRRISDLEKQMGVRLLERSTRKIRTTREGDILYQFASRGLEEINAGELAIQNLNEELKGTLRLSIPGDVNFWWSLLNCFQARYPNIHLDIFTTERRVDLIADGVDVVLRVGELKTRTAIVRKIGDYRHCLVASPAYLEKYGVAEHPEQLAAYPCGAWGRNREDIVWNFAGIDYPIDPKVKVNDFAHLLSLVLAGSIITELPPLLAKPLLDSGELVTLFDDLPMPVLTFNLLYPSRKYLSPLSRAYIDFALEYCKAQKIFNQ